MASGLNLLEIYLMKNLITLASVLGLGMYLVGCSTAPSSERDRRELHGAAQDTIDTFERTDPYMKRFLDRAYGYAVIPGVGKGGFLVGGAYGNGEVYERGVSIGWCDMSQ